MPGKISLEHIMFMTPASGLITVDVNHVESCCMGYVEDDDCTSDV